jgi:uncharacterized RDD family membrane protein YckC
VLVLEKEEAGSPYPRCSLWLRVGARLVDVSVAWGIFVLGDRAGAVLAILYLLLADGMLEGQSLGKRIFGIKVMHLPTRSAGRKRDSTLRNAPLALIVLFGMMPPPLGWKAFLAGLVAIGGVEAYRTVRDPLGLRWGDVWAQTQVVDGKVVAGTGVMARAGARDGPQRTPGRAMYAARRRQGGRVVRRRIQCGSR